MLPRGFNSRNKRSTYYFKFIINFNYKLKLNELDNEINNKLIYENELKKKVSNLNQLCNKYETAYQELRNDLEKRKIDSMNILNDLEAKKDEIETLKENHKKEINNLQNQNMELKKRENKNKLKYR